MYPLLSIKDLSIQFSHEGERSTAVSGSNINIAPKEILAIVGESGSGKSVTALSILGLLPPKTGISGELLFSEDGETQTDLLKLSLSKMNALRGSSIAMIFQEPMTSLNPVLTCGDQVIEAIRLHQKDPLTGKRISKEKAIQKTIRLFEKVKLPEPANMLGRYPHQLSGGQKQRVMIAMAMSCGPSLLIADEPTTALDVTVQKTILELIKELQEETGMSVILITHDLGIVAGIADKLVVMYKGTIIEQGNAKDILQAPKHEYTRALLLCRPSLYRQGARLPVVSDFMKVEGGDSGKAAEVPVSKALHQNKTPGQPLLKVENLRVSFPVKRSLTGSKKNFFNAVDDVSFEVRQGETLGLVGESGSGKTTIGRAILQLVKPSGGRILLHGQDITKVNKASLRSLRKDLQIVFQDPYGSLNPRLIIGNAIMEPLTVHGMLNNRKERKQRVIELLEKVDLEPDHFNRYPHQFSGGQRQRICIARALALNPSFIIFDESLSALDLSIQAQVLNLLNDLKKEFGFTSIFISHDLQVVHFFSDRIIVLREGKIVESGTSSAVYEHPKDPYTKKLIAAIPLLQII